MTDKAKKIKSGSNLLRFKIEGMDCPDCASTIEKNLLSANGVSNISVDFMSGNLEVSGDEPSATEIEKKVKSMGYRIASRPGENSVQLTGNRVRGGAIFPVWKIWSLAISTLLILSGGTLNYYDLNLLINRPLILSGMIVGGWQIAYKGLMAARRLRLDMNFLMAVAVIGAAIIGEWSEAGAVVILFALAQLLESFSLQRSRKAIGRLMDLSPRSATVLKDGQMLTVAVDEISTGDIVFARPGEKIAVDGNILKGNSSVNQATITGESLPVDKGPGDVVFAGTINGEGAIEVETTHAPGDTTLDHIIRLVEEAQTKRAPSQNFVDKFSAYYTPAVVGIAILLAIIPPLALNAAWTEWIYRALALLVISCPCALVISTPVTIVSALANAARNGVLIKGGAFLENACTVPAMAFDKTGTITTGKSAVDNVVALDGYDHDELLKIAASVETHSEHPIAKAILRYADAKGISYGPPTNFKSVPGQGAIADLDGQKYYLGNRALFSSLGLINAGVDTALKEYGNQSSTAVLVGSSSNVMGLLTLADELRPDSVEAIDRLRKEGIKHIVLLTGDNRFTAESVGGLVGADEIHAELLPQEKADTVRKLGAQFGGVIMVGDGVNDAPALASATIGIAMGAIGSDAALETADIALMADELKKLPWLLRLSRKARRIIIQNITISIIVKFIFVILASAGAATLWMAVFADMGISLLVIFNGMRTLRID
jgi:Cd2+/Zn2+-exporting ATPase